MSDAWNDVFLSVRDGDNGPWACAVCDADDPTVELGQKFRARAVVSSTLYCNSCTAQVEVPAEYEPVRR